MASGRFSRRCGTRGRSHESLSRKRDRSEAPAGDRVHKILCVFVLAEGLSRHNAVHIASAGFEDRVDIATIFAVVNLGELLPDGAILDFFGGAFQDDGLVSFLRADDNARVRRDVFCLAGTRAGTEPKGVLPPDSPNDHEMGTALRTGRGDPVIVGLFETFEGPGPGLETAEVFRGILKGIRPIGTAGVGFWHRASFQSSEMRGNCIKARRLSLRSTGFFLERESKELLRSSGDEGASDTEGALAGLLLPNGLQIHANGRKNRHVQNGQKIFRKILGRIKLYRNAAKAEI
jgi:hypothetical protein